MGGPKKTLGSKSPYGPREERILYQNSQVPKIYLGIWKRPTRPRKGRNRQILKKTHETRGSIKISQIYKLLPKPYLLVWNYNKTLYKSY